LAVGSKTTALPLAAGLLLTWLFLQRRELRRLGPALLAAAGAAVAVGGFWYLRNLVDHGSPFWPIVSTSWGDSVPPLIHAVDYSLLDRPRVTLEGHIDKYFDQL